MTSGYVLLPTSPVTVAHEDTGPPAIEGSGVVGSGAVWADGSDATYAAIASSFDYGNDYGYAPMAQSLIDPATVVDIVFGVRVQVDPDLVSTQVSITCNVPDFTSTLGQNVAGAIVNVDQGAPIQTLSLSLHSLLVAAYSADEILTYTQQLAGYFTSPDRQVQLVVAGTYSPGAITVARIYELSLTLVPTQPALVSDMGDSRQTFLRGR